MTLGPNSTKIALTGGGTAGHVMPNFALAPDLVAAGFEIHYIGSSGIERELVARFGIPFHEISSGKLRRYFSLENFLDIFKVILGVFQAFVVLAKLRPAVVFSKGGFVAVPVAVAARVLGIPVISHESDYTPGLANRIIGKFAKKLLYSFPETAKYIPVDKGLCVPSPIRRELFTGSRAEGLNLCGFSGSVPVILVMGGSLGAQRLNDALLASLPKLVERYQIVHLTGKGKGIPFAHSRYRGFEFLGDELRHVFAMTDITICRAGANSIFEMLALKIPMLLVPLEAGSRGDQVLNANSFASRGWATVLREKDMTPDSLYTAVNDLMASREAMKTAQKKINMTGGGQEVVKIIKSVISGN